MSILIGSTATQAGTETNGAKFATGFKFTVEKTGTLVSLTLKGITSGSGKKITLGLVKPKESSSMNLEKGTIIASGEGTIVSEVCTITGLFANVVAGEVLWLVVWSEEAIKFKRAAGETEISSQSSTKENTLALALSASGWLSEKHAPAEFVGEGPEGLVLAGETTIGATPDTISAGVAEAFQFTASRSGTSGAPGVRTGTTVNTGVTSVVLGVYSDVSNVPGTLLGEVTIFGTPGISQWIYASGLSASLTSGAKYWLAALPIGGTLHVLLKTGGATPDKESQTGLTKLPTSFKVEGSFTDGPASIAVWGAEAVEEAASLMAMMA